MPSRLLAVLATGAALALAACGAASTPKARSTSTPTPAPTEVSPAGDIPDNQAYVTFHAPGAPYSVKVPEGWSQTERGSVVTFTDKLNSIELAWGNAPSAAPAGAKTSTVKRTGGSAERATFEQQSEPDAVTGKTRTNAVERYVFTRGSEHAVLTLKGPKGADNVDPWRVVTDSLRWTA
ncbi:hypothetical protein OM076_15340 [Solirubrobacter ginsenosidimutans]|uniref:DUF1795 domain-containing protein n=1 Tax=Solirubrobacter ginsenosidimutans TaxID=490573 RepID=A0A9X3MTN4_9ACTN|nr:hypothetical protein [Solirubrobacter ginsenosidimutans]MDA0161651.1 hypothetical protein [Solirubrobacter ginsenosidimutans]